MAFLRLTTHPAVSLNGAILDAMLGFWGNSPRHITQLKGHLPEASRLSDGKMKKRKGLAAGTGLFPGARTI
jgi:hypothetical protein